MQSQSSILEAKSSSNSFLVETGLKITPVTLTHYRNFLPLGTQPLWAHK